MKKRALNSTYSYILALATAFCAAATQSAQAQFTWNSAGPSDNWSTAGGNENWSPGGVVWTQNEDAIFNATAENINVTTANTFDDMTFDITGFTITSAGAGSLVLSDDFASTITVTNLADTATINETIANNGGGASTLTKAGAGTLVLFGTAANTYTGGTTISAGTLTASHEGALGTGAVTNNATLNLNKANVTFTGLSTSMSGNGITNVTAIGTGTQTVVLNGNYSAYTGSWDVGIGAAAGAGKIQMNGADNAATVINIRANATLFTNGAGINHLADITLNGGDTGEAIGQLRVEGGATWSGDVTLAAAMTGTDSFVGSNTGIGTISGNIGETGGAKTLSKGGGGTLVLSGTNNYSGGTVIRNNTLSVSVLNNTGVAGNVGTGITISIGNAGTGATLLYTGAGETTDRVINLSGTTGGATLTQSGVSGHLKFTSALTAAGAGAKTLTLQGSTAGTAELAGAVVNSTGTTAITKAGSGTWTLSGTNTNTGATTVNAGTLRLNYDTGVGGTNTNKLADAGVLTLGGGTVELVGGSHTEVVASTALTNLTTNFITRTGGTSVLQMGAITPNSGTVTFSADGIATTTTANINGILGPWAKVNSNWATNSGGSIVAYTAYTDVSQFFDGTPAGTIPNSVANNIRIINGGTTGNITLAGGALTQANTLQNTSTGATIDPTNATDVLNIGDNIGGGVWQTSGAGSLVIGTAADDGVLTTGGAINAAAANLRITNDSMANQIVVNSLIANNGTDVVTVTKTGNGTLVLNGSDSYTGSTVVKEGTLTLAGNRTVAYASGSVFTVGDTAGTNATLNISGGTHSIGGASSRINVGNQAGAPGTSTVNQTGGAVIFNAAAGDMLLVGQNTVGNTGIYNLSGGSLTTFTNAARGVILGVNSNPAPGPTSGGGTFNLSGTGVLNMTAASGGSGDAILQIGRSDAVANNTTNLFNQTGGTANVGILALGGNTGGSTGVSATLTLSAGTFSANGFTLLSAGSTNTSVINIRNTTDVTLPNFPTARGAGSTATINFDGGTLRPAAGMLPAQQLAYMEQLTNAFIEDGGAKIDVATGISITIAQNLLTHGTSLGGGLTKDGVGKLTLTGTASTYTGPTTIVEGNLSVNGNISTSSLVTVEAGGTLSGSGTVGAVSVLAGGTVAPGNSPGILNSGAITTSGGTYEFEIGGIAPGNSATDHDQLAVTGSLNLGSSVAVATFTLSGYSPTGSEMFVLIKNDLADPIIGQFSSLSEGTLVILGGNNYYATYTADAENNLRTGGNDFALIPEPTHWALALGAGGLMLLRRSR